MFPANVSTEGSMKVINVAGVMLVFLLAGCADMYPSSASKSSADRSTADASMQNRTVAYHNANFGDPDNQPFQGSFAGR
jgi:hypothetical protein